MDTIEEQLLRLGINQGFKGFQILLESCRLGIEDEDRLNNIRGNLLSRCAAADKCSIRCIERNLQTLMKRAWKTNPDYLLSISGLYMTEAPTVSQLIEILVTRALNRKDR